MAAFPRLVETDTPELETEILHVKDMDIAFHNFMNGDKLAFASLLQSQLDFHRKRIAQDLDLQNLEAEDLILKIRESMEDYAEALQRKGRKRGRGSTSTSKRRRMLLFSKCFPLSKSIQFGSLASFLKERVKQRPLKPSDAQEFRLSGLSETTRKRSAVSFSDDEDATLISASTSTKKGKKDASQCVRSYKDVSEAGKNTGKGRGMEGGTPSSSTLSWIDASRNFTHKGGRKI